MTRTGRLARIVAIAAVTPVVALSGVSALGAGPAGASAAGGSAAMTLYVSAGTGNDTGHCTSQSSPCKTIQYAVGQAESDTGAVTIQISGGTYAEQVTVAPSGTSQMTSLTLQGPSSGSPAVVEPTSLLQNVTEGSTSQYLDDNTGQTAAIIGVQTGSTDTAAGNSTAGNGATVTVENLTVSGGALGGLPPGGKLEGIAFIDTGGTVGGNLVENIEQPGAMSHLSVHGIEVNSTVSSSSVSVSDNTVEHEGGHVAIDLTAATPGALQAQVTANTLVGDPSTNTAGVVQWGIGAGGLNSLTISGNRITDYQSPASSGGIWLDPQAGSAPCQVTSNVVLSNDEGIALRGASGCSILDNQVSAGNSGINLGESMTSTASSRNNVVASNQVTGTTTVNTSEFYNGSAAVPAITMVPIDGVLVFDGSGNVIDSNVVSGFAADIYVGRDPVWMNNTATWGGGGPPSSTAGFNNSGNRVERDDVTALATPAARSGVGRYGVANLYNSFALDARNNWWGCPTGPGTAGCTTRRGNVYVAPWAQASIASSSSSSSTTPGGSTTVSNDNTSATASGGTGTATVSQYSSDPTGPPNFSSSGEYIDVSLSPASSFSLLSVQDCNLGGGTLLQWWDPSGGGRWVVLADQIYSGGSRPCITATFTYSTTPSLSQLAGSIFAVGTALGATNTSLAASPNPASAGAPVTLTATVTARQATSNAISGTVGFLIGTTPIQQCAAVGVSSLGTATCVTSFSPAGNYAVSAVYSGNAYFAGSTGTAAVDAVPLATATTTALTASPSSTTQGAAVTLTARVSPADATGTVEFLSRGTPIPSCSAVATSPFGTASCVTSFAAPGTYVLSATYSGNTSFSASSSNAVTVQVGPRPPLPSPSPMVGMATDPVTGGYWLVTARGNVYNFDAPWYGSVAGRYIPSRVVGMAADPATGGYWLVTARGNVYNFDAPWHGSVAGRYIPSRVVGMAADPATGGYWLVTARGNVYNFDAPFHGSVAGRYIPSPIVGMAADPATGGYWLVTARGNVYNFDAPFHGSEAAKYLPSPVVGIATDRATGGYWLASASGNVYNLDAPGYGSLVGRYLPSPVVGIAAARGDIGYWMIERDGTFDVFGGAANYGSHTGG